MTMIWLFCMIHRAKYFQVRRSIVGNDTIFVMAVKQVRRRLEVSRCEVQKRCNVWLAHDGSSYFKEVKPTASDSTDCTLG